MIIWAFKNEDVSKNKERKEGGSKGESEKGRKGGMGAESRKLERKSVEFFKMTGKERSFRPFLIEMNYWCESFCRHSLH